MPATNSMALVLQSNGSWDACHVSSCFWAVVFSLKLAGSACKFVLILHVSAFSENGRCLPKLKATPAAKEGAAREAATLEATGQMSRPC